MQMKIQMRAKGKKQSQSAKMWFKNVKLFKSVSTRNIINKVYSTSERFRARRPTAKLRSQLQLDS